MGRKDVWNVPPVMPDKLKKRLTKKVAPLMQQKKVLSAREWAFVKEYVSGDGMITMKEAAIRAGFSPKSASSTASRLTNPDHCPHVVAAIQEYRAELAEKYGTNFDRHMRDLQKIRDAALEAGAFGAAVQAEYRRGQALGTIYVDRKEIRVGTIDSMSKDEVREKLAELQKLYGGPPPKRILDATAEEVIDTVESDPEFHPEDALDGDEPRNPTVQAAEGEPAGLPYHPDRKPREPRYPGLPDSIGEEPDFRDDGIEGRQEREEDPN
jgi:phage terminase small subunit